MESRSGINPGLQTESYMGGPGRLARRSADSREHHKHHGNGKEY
jgi:hypothetical protein